MKGTVAMGVLVIAIMGLTGCSNPTPGLAVISFNEALELVRDTVGEPGVLVYAGAMAYDTPWAEVADKGGRLEDWHLGYYDALTSQLVDVRFFADRAPEVYRGPGWLGVEASMRPLPTSLGIDSIDALRIAAESLNVSASDLEDAPHVTYWLSMHGDIPLWRLVISNGTDQVFAVDAATGDLLNPLPILEAPFSFAYPLAKAAILPLVPDARLIEASGREDPEGGFMGPSFSSGWNVSQVLNPPDVFPGDGNTAAWSFIFRSDLRREWYPVVVYADGLTVPGQAVRGPSDSSYGTYALPENPIDSDEAMEAAMTTRGILPLLLWTHYNLAEEWVSADEARDAWSLALWPQRPGEHWFVDASTGQVLGSTQ